MFGCLAVKEEERVVNFQKKAPPLSDMCILLLLAFEGNIKQVMMIPK